MNETEISGQDGTPDMLQILLAQANLVLAGNQQDRHLFIYQDNSLGLNMTEDREKAYRECFGGVITVRKDTVQL